MIVFKDPNPDEPALTSFKSETIDRGGIKAKCQEIVSINSDYVIEGDPKLIAFCYYH